MAVSIFLRGRHPAKGLGLGAVGFEVERVGGVEPVGVRASPTHKTLRASPKP